MILGIIIVRVRVKLKERFDFFVAIKKKIGNKYEDLLLGSLPDRLTMIACLPDRLAPVSLIRPIHVASLANSK